MSTAGITNVRPVTKLEWEQHQKIEALEWLEKIKKQIKSGKLKVVSTGFWVSEVDGGATFRIDLKDPS
jgi:hypothetical protein